MFVLVTTSTQSDHPQNADQHKQSSRRLRNLILLNVIDFYSRTLIDANLNALNSFAGRRRNNAKRIDLLASYQ